jgi:hypothetical protein
MDSAVGSNASPVVALPAEDADAKVVIPALSKTPDFSTWTESMDKAVKSGNDPVVALLQDILDVLETIAGDGKDLDTAALLKVLVDLLAKPMDKKLGQIQAAKART